MIQKKRRLVIDIPKENNSNLLNQTQTKEKDDNKKTLVPLSMGRKNNNPFITLSQVENPQVAIKNRLNTKVIYAQSLIHVNKAKNKTKQLQLKEKSSVFHTPKNSFSLREMLSQISSNKKSKQSILNLKEEHKQLITMILPDPFEHLLLEPCEYSVRYNPCYVIEYSLDIFDYITQEQNHNQPITESILLTQPNITKTKRAALVNWLITIHLKFKLLDETLYLSINIIDRYLSLSPPIDSDSTIALIGICSMLIACKFEEIYPPEIRDFTYAANRGFTKETILQMEEEILNKLHYDLLAISPVIFLGKLFFISNDANIKTLFLSKYLLELSLLDINFYRYSPMIRASSALFLSRRIYKNNIPWPTVLRFKTNLTEEDITKCAKEMCFLLNNIKTTQCKASLMKYSNDDNYSVSMM